MTVSCMRNASGHNYRNSSFTVDAAIQQIPLTQNVFLVIDKITRRKRRKWKEKSKGEIAGKEGGR